MPLPNVEDEARSTAQHNGCGQMGMPAAKTVLKCVVCEIADCLVSFLGPQMLTLWVGGQTDLPPQSVLRPGNETQHLTHYSFKQFS